MVFVTYVFAAVVLLGFCIFVHEFGHLIGGRMVGIKAEVFSMGYGKGVLKKKIGETTYQVTLIPFGGYCKFYGDDPSVERKGESYEFLSAPPLKRIVPVIMGPLFNLFFGIVLFFIMNMIGYEVETNRVYIPDYFKTGNYISPAHKAGIVTGDTVIAIDGERITSFSGIQNKTVFSKGKTMRVAVLRDGARREFTITPERYTEKGYFTMGVMPYGERVLVVNTLEKDRAESSGIEKFDEIRTVDGKAIKTPADFTDYIRDHAEKKVVLSIVRRGVEIKKTVIPRLREEIVLREFEDARFKGEKSEFSITDNTRIKLIKESIDKKTVRINGKTIDSFSGFIAELGNNRDKRIVLENKGGSYSGIVDFRKYGFIGIETAIAPEMVLVRYGLIDGAARAVIEPFNFVIMNLKGLGMLISGKLDVRQNLSGPIKIAKIAGDTAHYRGISAFIMLMAKISIILMVMNLLPIPAVDGSHILIYLFEAIKGSPINEKILEKIQMAGFAILILLGVFVIFNDLASFEFFQKLFN